jgi:hypothetical protein
MKNPLPALALGVRPSATILSQSDLSSAISSLASKAAGAAHVPPAVVDRLGAAMKTLSSAPTSLPEGALALLGVEAMGAGDPSLGRELMELDHALARGSALP